MSSPLETIAAKAQAASAVTYTGSGVAFLGGLTANEFAAVGGLAIGFIGLLVNVWFKAQHLKIAKKRAEADRDE